MRQVVRMAGFAFVPAFSILASLVLLPIVSSRFGAVGWVALGVGQSLGAVVSVLGGLSWPMRGGHLVASEPDKTIRANIFALSIATRGLATAVLIIPAATAACLIVPHQKLATSLFMVGIALNSLSASWYFAGTAQPLRLVVNEAIPRAGSYVLAILAMYAWDRSLNYYAAATVLGAVTSALLNWSHIVGSHIRRGREELTFSTIRTTFSEHFLGTLARFSLALYSFGGPSLYSIVALSSLPTYTALDQTLKAGINASTFVPQAFISWVGGAHSGAQRTRRVMISASTIVAIAITGFIAWMAIGHNVMTWMFSKQIDASGSAITALGAALAVTLIVRGLELVVLIPLEMERDIYVSTLCISVIGLAALPVSAVLWGAVGGIWAWTVTQSLQLVVYLIRVTKQRELNLGPGGH